MDIITSAYGWEFLFRFLHFLAGITWVGVLYYFNFIQTPFFGTELGGQAKSAMTRGLVPNALWWFRWGAMLTFLSGWTLILMYLTHGGMSLGDGLITRILTGGAMGSIMWFNVWFIIWPAQKKALGIVQVDDAAKAAAGRTAMLFSRTNTMLSIPMLYAMTAAQNLV